MARDSFRILLIEDSAAHALLIKGLLADASEPRFTLRREPTLRAGLDALKVGGIDAVLLDLTLPDGEGIESFRRVRAAAPQVPIIVLTGLDSDEVATLAVKEGAQDYLKKRHLNRDMLLRCVRYAIDRRGAEMELAQARKMESIGQLAAGIAHEVNTPTQFIGDSLAFLKDCFADLEKLRADCMGAFAALEAGGGYRPLVEQVRKRCDEIELDYLETEIPRAFERAEEGVRRVAEVVCAMREFSHPSGRQKELADLNRSIENTLTIARSQYRYVADVVTDLGDIPLVRCHVGEINQTLLNLIVNAAQAIEDAKKDPQERGVITVRSRLSGDAVRIEVCDNGVGIKDELRTRVFDPFFTTKEVGRGTGQGLSLSHAAIVKLHGGRLDVESRPGMGSTFWFTLPIEEQPEADGQ